MNQFWILVRNFLGVNVNSFANNKQACHQKYFLESYFLLNIRNTSPSSNSICLCLMNCSGSVQRGEQAAGCYPDLNISSWGRDGSSSTSHQKISSYDQKKGMNKTETHFFHCIVSCEHKPGMQSSAAEFPEKV